MIALGPPDPALGGVTLVPIARVSSVGPPREVVDLAEWAATRWGSPRIRPFLVAASPPTMVAGLGPARRTVTVQAAGPDDVGSGVRRITPLTDPLAMVAEIVRRGPAIVIHPTPAAARAIASRLRKRGLRVALVPDEWAGAAAGVDVVVGSRGAVWAPCPGLRSIVVLDEHDESLQDERTPTWHARDVAIERSRRAGAACVLVSPCPTAAALHWAGPAVTRPTASGSCRWLAVRRDRRPDGRGAVETVTRRLGTHHPSAACGRPGGVCDQHDGARPVARLPLVSVAAALRSLRRRGVAGRPQPPRLRPLWH